MLVHSPQLVKECTVVQYCMSDLMYLCPCHPLLGSASSSNSLNCDPKKRILASNKIHFPQLHVATDKRIQKQKHLRTFHCWSGEEHHKSIATGMCYQFCNGDNGVQHALQKLGVCTGEESDTIILSMRTMGLKTSPSGLTTRSTSSQYSSKLSTQHHSGCSGSSTDWNWVWSTQTASHKAPQNKSHLKT